MNDNVSNLKKQNLKLNLIILILIVVIVIASLMGGYALYTTVQNKNINVPIAGWQFKVDGKLQNSGEIEFAMTRLDTNNQVKEGMVAPGTYGEFPIYVDVTGVDTAVEYSIDIDITNKPTYLKFYGQRINNGTEEEPNYKYDYEIAVKKDEVVPENGKFVIKGYMSLAEVEAVKRQAKDEGKTQAVREETIYWEWPYEYDTLVKASQHIGTGTQLDINMVANAKIAMDKYDETDTNDILNEDGSMKQVVMTITAKGIQSLKGPEKYIILGNGRKVPLTRENVANYYGAEVNVGENSDNVYRLFYVDFANDYGDGEGTIYLKADLKKDWDQSIDGIKLLDKIASYNLSTANNEKFINMNPQWANYGTNSSKNISTYANNEKGALWLADPNVWAVTLNDDINNIKSKYNINNNDIYAIGSPSVEMYVDSYNASQGYKYLDLQVNSIGYQYKTVGGNWGNNIGWYTINTYRNGMYSSLECGLYKRMLFASLSAWNVGSLCSLNTGALSLSGDNLSTVCGVTPIVSLKSNTLLELK